MEVTEFMKHPIVAAIRTREDFDKAMKSDVDMVFLLHSNIMTLKSDIDKSHDAGKKAFVHIDFAEGVGRDRAGMKFLKELGADGIGTTRTNLVRMAKENGLITVQRFFMIDSHSVTTSIDSMKISKPDVVEMMPAIVTKKIHEFADLVDVPIIAGGLVETIDEVRAALEAGATVVSTSDPDLWTLSKEDL
jgi:glycerol uptake operon antiterminator